MISLNSLFTKIKNTFYGRLKENICFLHVPKCGGTSLGQAIRTRYPTLLELGLTNYMVSLSAPASSNVIKLACQTDYPNDHRKIEEDITTYLQTVFGQSQGYEYVKFLGGADPTGDYKSRGAIDRAKRNLHNFDVVGLLEYQGDFLERFADRFGIRLRMEKRNQSPVSGAFRESLVTDEIRKKVMTICEPDYEIYQYAVNNFVR